MKLYSKKLNSLDELKAEKLRLQHEAKHVFDIEFASSGKTNKANDGKNSIDSAILNIFKTKTPAQIITLILDFGVPILTQVGIKTEKKILTKTAKTVLLGYLKWKALELGYKNIYAYLRAKKKK